MIGPVFQPKVIFLYLPMVSVRQNPLLPIVCVLPVCVMSSQCKVLFISVIEKLTDTLCEINLYKKNTSCKLAVIKCQEIERSFGRSQQDQIQKC